MAFFRLICCCDIAFVVSEQRFFTHEDFQDMVKSAIFGRAPKIPILNEEHICPLDGFEAILSLRCLSVLRDQLTCSSP